MTNDTIADLLTRIRNAQRAGHKVTRVPSSKMSMRVLEVLKTEGFISSFKTLMPEGEKFEQVDVALKYYSTGEPVIGLARRISTPGLRKYVGSEKLPRVKSGLGISIVSTSQGVMSDREARKRRIGGEVLAFIG